MSEWPMPIPSKSLLHFFICTTTHISPSLSSSFLFCSFPWLEAVYKFKISTLQPGRPDFANFYIPGRGGFGRYIVQYYWSGYRDCVDVDYKPQQVANVYGVVSNVTRWNRIDHCLFPQARRVFSAHSEIVTDASYCLNRCGALTECSGVNVVPIRPPTTAFNFPKPNLANWTFPNIPGADILVPWEEPIFDSTRDLFMQPENAQKYMCYSVMPRQFTDTKDEFYVTSDPEDPVFYSTCYYRLQGNVFEEYLDQQPGDTTRVGWRYNDKCINCQQQATNSFLSVTPEWNIAPACTNCDREPKTVSPPSPPKYLVEANTRCDGQPTFSRPSHHTCGNSTAQCTKIMVPLGRLGANTAVTMDECAIMVARDPECSDTFSFRKTVASCFCYTKKECCKTCSRREDSTWDTYTITKSTPDPTCATGVPSADGLACCSASCGAGNCRNTTAPVDPVGFCCASCITRPCSMYGPPCKLL